jgi:hypothetical protein
MQVRDHVCHAGREIGKCYEIGKQVSSNENRKNCAGRFDGVYAGLFESCPMEPAPDKSDEDRSGSPD